MRKNSPVTPKKIIKVNLDSWLNSEDLTVKEEPLEIRLRFGPEHSREEKSLAVTMRTPGNDFELTAGFLITEGIVSDFSKIIGIRYCQNTKPEEEGNVVLADLHPAVEWDPIRMQRNFYASSSCGICGKATLESIKVICEKKNVQFSVPSATIFALSDVAKENQAVFKVTGGLHAAALFDNTGKFKMLREDIGRHNALDKLIGACLHPPQTLIQTCILFTSGRAGFEILQKAAVAGISMVVSVGAPSDLAISVAEEMNITLIGFSGRQGYNIYAHEWRIQP